MKLDYSIFDKDTLSKLCIINDAIYDGIVAEDAERLSIWLYERLKELKELKNV